MKLGTLFVGAILGASAIAAPPLLSQDVAVRLSQYLDDCGIKIASGANGGTVTGFAISGHRTAVCVYSTSGLHITSNLLDQPLGVTQ